MTRIFLAAILAATCTLAQPRLEGPTAGFVFDAAARQVRAIRGIVGTELTPDFACALGRAMASLGWAKLGRAPVLAVGRDGSLSHLRAFGRLSYDPGAAEVATDTIYDLASLTKVVVTTTLSMILVDEGRLDLDARVHARRMTAPLLVIHDHRDDTVPFSHGADIARMWAILARQRKS